MSLELFESILEHLFQLSILQRDKPSIVSLFSWGEPMLHPRINDFLRSLKEKNLHAVLSSNFVHTPLIEEELLPVIMNMVFSLSGFSQDSYEKIHGARLSRVLDNFNRFHADVRRHAPMTRIMIAWHRYQFNEGEFWQAYKYFDRPQVAFRPETAFSDDVIEMLQIVSGEDDAITEPRWKSLTENIFIDHMMEKMRLHRLHSGKHECQKWNEFAIDERGQLLLCTGIGTNDVDHVLGDILQMSAEQIWEKKLSDPLCTKCVATGLSRYLDLPPYNQKPLPSGGGLSNLKLRSVMKMISAKCWVTSRLSKSRHGDRLLKFIKLYRRKKSLHFFGMHPL